MRREWISLCPWVCPKEGASPDQRGEKERGGLYPAANVARRTHAAALATERDQEVTATAGAAGASEAVCQNTASQIGPEVALDPRGDAARHGIRLGDLCEEGLEMVLDQRIERRQGGDGAGGRRAHSSMPWAEGDAIAG